MDQADRKGLSFVGLFAEFFLFLVAFLKERRVFAGAFWKSFGLLPPTLFSFSFQLLVFRISWCYFKCWLEEMIWQYCGVFLPTQSSKENFYVDFVVILIYRSRRLYTNMSVLQLLISSSPVNTVVSSKLAKILSHWASKSSMKME